MQRRTLKTAVDQPMLAFQQIAALVAEPMARVDRLFTEELASDLPNVALLVKHVSRFRGKMLRPLLTLLAGQACGPLNRSHVVLATVVEMVHMATLVHDDVLDDAELRRRGATINHLKGNEAAVMLGDYLISHSYHLCASLGSQSASRLVAATTNRICEGELLQIDNRNNLDLGEEVYFDIISRKTASLIGVSCVLGAQFSNATAEQTEALEAFGIAIGNAFQIQDDVLDIVGDADAVGKTLGLDVAKGKLTLPMIHFMRSAPREHGELLRSMLTANDADKAEKIRNLILPSNSIGYARERAVQLTERARAGLEALPPSPARDALDRLAQLVVDRPV